MITGRPLEKVSSSVVPIRLRGVMPNLPEEVNRAGDTLSFLAFQRQNLYISVHRTHQGSRLP